MCTAIMAATFDQYKETKAIDLKQRVNSINIYVNTVSVTIVPQEIIMNTNIEFKNRNIHWKPGMRLPL